MGMEKKVEIVFWEVTECLLEKSKFIILNVTEILKLLLKKD